MHPCPPPVTPLTTAHRAAVLRRGARLVEAEADYLARLAPHGFGSTRRSLRRQAATCAADARVLRQLAREGLSPARPAQAALLRPA